MEHEGSLPSSQQPYARPSSKQCIDHKVLFFFVELTVLQDLVFCQLTLA